MTEEELCGKHWRAGRRSVLLRLDIPAYRRLLVEGGASREQVDATQNLTMLVSMHKVRCILEGIPPEAKRESEEFLRAHGCAAGLRRAAS